MDTLENTRLLTKINIVGLSLAILVSVVIPNIVLFIICYHFGFDRPLINIDYFIPILLIPLFKSKLSEIFIFFIFLAVFSIDILLIALQVFPFITLSDIIYLSNFIFVGPINFRIYLIFLVFLVVLEFFFITKITKKVHIKTLLGIFIVCFCTLILNHLYKKDTHFSLNSLINSNSLFLLLNSNTDFLKLKNLTPLTATKYQTASNSWFKQIKNKATLNNKLLLIVNESWGVPKNSKVQESTLEILKSQKDLFEFFEQGSFDVIGSTVGGELRELCQLDPLTLDLHRVHQGYESCLPNLLKPLGYKSIALHGNDSVMYARNIWYPLAGIDNFFTGLDFTLPKDSFSNHGIFDPDLMPFIANNFQQNNKLLFYWLTLITHTPYPEKDIHNHRFNCLQFDIDRDTESCRNLMLQTQFFDALAKLIQMPEMRGVEVIIAGDHPPPLLSLREGFLTFESSKVSWIHFKIKDTVQKETNNSKN